MSIKVMSWVWDHSDASGSELLLLLAIADQANDDGRDAWPSIKTLAQRTRLDERTVRRVLKRLARSGHIIVRPGGGRRSNHYDVIMTRQTDELSTPLADRHPGQNATPGRSPGHPGRTARAPLAQLCQASPDTAMPSDPSYTRPGPLLPRDEHAPRLSVVPTPDGGGGIDQEAVELLAGLGPDWRLSPGQRRRLAPLVSAALATGWTKAALTAHLAANPDGVKSPAAVLAARLNDLPDPITSASEPADRPTWCGACDQTTRHQERPDGRIQRCPTCHPTHVAELMVRQATEEAR